LYEFIVQESHVCVFVNSLTQKGTDGFIGLKNGALGAEQNAYKLVVKKITERNTNKFFFII
jgi:hypothetical protein